MDTLIYILSGKPWFTVTGIKQHIPKLGDHVACEKPEDITFGVVKLITYYYKFHESGHVAQIIRLDCADH